MSFWKNDNFFVGIVIGLLLTVLTTLIIMVVFPLLYAKTGLFEPNSKFLLLSIVPGILMMRHYMRVRNFMKSGSGVLVIIFLAIILYFVLIENKVSDFPALF